jgi:hypothetical protein
MTPVRIRSPLQMGWWKDLRTIRRLAYVREVRKSPLGARIAGRWGHQGVEAPTALINGQLNGIALRGPGVPLSGLGLFERSGSTCTVDGVSTTAMWRRAPSDWTPTPWLQRRPRWRVCVFSRPSTLRLTFRLVRIAETPMIGRKRTIPLSDRLVFEVAGDGLFNHNLPRRRCEAEGLLGCR